MKLLSLLSGTGSNSSGNWINGASYYQVSGRAGLLTDELKEKIGGAESLTVLEDIYLPFRPKRRTRQRWRRRRA